MELLNVLIAYALIHKLRVDLLVHHVQVLHQNASMVHVNAPIQIQLAHLLVVKHAHNFKYVTLPVCVAVAVSLIVLVPNVRHYQQVVTEIVVNVVVSVVSHALWLQTAVILLLRAPVVHVVHDYLIKRLKLHQLIKI